MNLNSLETILIAGVNIRAIAKSCKKLGLNVIGIDQFDDMDLEKHVDKLYLAKKDEKESENSLENELFELTYKALNSHDIDAIILTSGMEHNYGKVGKLEKRIPILGNNSSKLEVCEKKEKILKLAKKLEIPTPKTRRIKTLEEARKAGEKIGYPVLLKPESSGGGIGIKLAENQKEIRDSFEEAMEAKDSETLYMQEYVRGVDASGSVISNGNESVCLSVNKQIIGDERLDVPRKFGYCGNIIPLSEKKETVSRIRQYSEKICTKLELVGSNGVDFVVSNGKPYLMEVNPRFQNTTDMVEESFGLNMVEKHIQSTEGEIPQRKKLEKCSGKLIIYARKDFQVPDLTQIPNIVDIPREGSTIEKEEPICSVLKTEKKRSEMVRELYEAVRQVQRECYNSSN